MKLQELVKQETEATYYASSDLEVNSAPEVSGPMTIEEALLLYKNLQLSLSYEIDSLLSPFIYNNKGQQHKTKTQSKRMTDLATAATVVKTVLRDIEPNPNQFETQKAKNLYGSMLAVFKAKEVIKADLRAKLMSGDVPENLSQELKDKLLKDL